MLIEYKLKFDKSGLTLTQQVQPSASGSQKAETFLEQNYLKASFQESKAATASAPRSGGGGGVEPPGDDTGGGVPTDFGTSPITIIGPFIICCSSSDPQKEGKD